MAYQQPPDQTTVIHPIVVVKPEQPKLKSDGYEAGACILGIGVVGGLFIAGSILLCISAATEFADLPRMSSPFVTVLIIGITLGVIGVGFCCVCFCGMKISKDKHEKHRQRDEIPAPRYEPYTDAENSPGYTYSGQGQPAVGQPVVGTGSTVYVPVQSNVLPETPYPHQDSGISYHNATSPVSNSSQMRPEHQPFLKGIDAVPGEAAYPGPTSYSVSENDFTPDYDQQPAYAPPKYSP